MKFSRQAAFIVASLTMPFITLQTTKADQIEVPNVFSGGTPALADEVNENFSVLANESNSQDGRINELEDGVFTSGWSLIGRAGQLVIDHDLGAVPSNVVVQISANSAGTIVHMGGYMTHFIDEQGGRGVVVTDITDESVRVRAGNSEFCSVFDTFIASAGSNRRCLATGYVRVIVYE